LILRKISKIGANRCHILRLKCTKFGFRWGSAPDPAGGAYSVHPHPLAVFKGPTSKGREREGEGKRRGGIEGRAGGESCPPQMGSLDPPVFTLDHWRLQAPMPNTKNGTSCRY